MKATQKAPAFAALHWSARTNLALMEHLQTSPTIVAGENGTAVTDDGLVVKNVHRAERINTNFEARVEAPFESWQVCRLVRRDFNFVTSKSFHRTAHRRQTGHDLRDLGYDLRLQAEFFRDDVSNLPTNPAPDVKVVPIRLFTNLGEACTAPCSSPTRRTLASITRSATTSCPKPTIRPTAKILSWPGPASRHT